jgi:hypothetical protein
MAYEDYHAIIRDSKWVKGGARTIKGQVYTCQGFERYTTRADIDTALVVLSTHCAECAAIFIVKAPAQVRPDNLMLNRRCPKHKRPGVQVGGKKRAKRKPKTKPAAKAKLPSAFD